MPGRALVVAYYFPPIGGVGVRRTLKYVTYLPQSGWESVVVTARNPAAEPRDPEAERNLPPGLIVERAFSPEPAKVRRALGSVVRRIRRPRGNRTAGGAIVPAAAAAAPAPRKSGFARKLAGRLWYTAMKYTFFPDEEVGWVPFAIRSGMAVHRKMPVDIVYSSSGPISSHLAAAVIARRTGKPWVADFRDPWIGNAFAAPLPRLHRYLQKRIERRIVHAADTVVFATDGMLHAYAARYPRAAGKFVTIPNGYDRNDLPVSIEAAAAPARPGDAARPFHLAYGGSIYGERELQIFLDGLELLVARRPEVRDRLTVEFIGWLNLYNQALAARYSAPDRLGAMLRFSGFLPHREAVARLVAADALLQLIADEPNKGQIQGGKLMEYVGLDRQILAVVPEGVARDMLRELDWGVIADPTPEGVAGGVERLLVTPAPRRHADPEGRYDRVNLARRLAAEFDRVSAVAEPGRG